MSEFEKLSSAALLRRKLLSWLAAPVIAAAVPNAVAQTQTVYRLAARRDAGCGCCHVWANVMKTSNRLDVTMTEEPDMAAFKARLGVPAKLASCHTAVIDGYVIEGHVPLKEILRLVSERPTGVKGLAVPGMPRGSPGMEMPNGARDTFEVIAFDAKGAGTVFARYDDAS